MKVFWAAAASAALLAASAWSIRAGWADYQMRSETVHGTERAIALEPDNAEYRARLAWLAADEDPARAKDALRRAVALDPWDARSWIELGLNAAAEGDDTTAEQHLLRAAEQDHEFLPRWTLANFYFRRNDEGKFWFWIKQAAAMAYGDPRPMFRLCGRVEEDGRLIERLDIRSPELRAGYLLYLLGQQRVDLLGPSVGTVLEQNREEDVPLLLTASERLLLAGRVEESARLWNGLADARRVAFRTPAGTGEQLVANAGFAQPPASRGFDWRLGSVEGVSIAREAESGGLRVTFSGREPEQCEPVEQLVPVQGNARYELMCAYRTQGIASGAGLGWRVANGLSGAVLGEGRSLASETDALERLVFETPAECRLIRLVLRYQRAAGTTRAEGFLILRSLGLKRLENQFGSLHRKYRIAR